jgi:hypothetical protein
LDAIGLAAWPSLLYLQVAALDPAQFSKSLLERSRLVLAQRVACLHSHENADLADLLSRRRRSEQPACRCSADDADEIAPPHCPSSFHKGICDGSN